MATHSYPSESGGIYHRQNAGLDRLGQLTPPVNYKVSDPIPRYFAHISQKGKVRYGDVPGSIGVLESLDKFMPIGEASCRTRDENRLAVWTLRIDKVETPGRWIIVDREFRSAEEEGGKRQDGLCYD